MEAEQTTLLNDIETIYGHVRGGTRTLALDDNLEEDLDIDSLLAMELLVKLEDHFAVTIIGDPRGMRLRTVGDLVSLLAELKEPAVSAADVSTTVYEMLRPNRKS